MARYIDADKIDYTMASVYWDKDENGKDIYRRCAVAFESDIDELPTADVAEVKHGEWRLRPDGSGTCNQCGRTQKAVWDFDNAQEYCGKCGAKMDGGNAE